MDLELSPEERQKLQELKSELQSFKRERGQLIPILQWIQERLSFLPSQALESVAEYLQIAYAEVFGVATFYNQFRFHPPGRNPIRVCLGTACHVKGADIILENFERKLGIREGETTPDREFSIERVACVGCCALAPVTLMGETVHGYMAPSKVEGLITRVAIEKEVRERERKKGAHV